MASLKRAIVAEIVARLAELRSSLVFSLSRLMHTSLGSLGTGSSSGSESCSI